MGLISLSWVCPKCKMEGDTRFKPGSREPLVHCPYYTMAHTPGDKVLLEATSNVMQDEETGKIQLSQAWIDASGYASDGTEVYIVRGFSGEYEDQTSWLVRAFMTWEAAKIWAIMAEMAAWRLHADSPDWPHWWRCELLSTDYDHKINLQYTGVRYYVDAVPFTREDER